MLPRLCRSDAALSDTLVPPAPLAPLHPFSVWNLPWDLIRPLSARCQLTPPLSVNPPAVGLITTMTIRYPPVSLIDIECWTRTISGSYRADSERGRSGIGPTAGGVTDSGPTAS
jgi:hypothetical protein